METEGTKNIIVLCDGTWNDSQSQTNVFRLKTILETKLYDCYYESGVGTGMSKIINGVLACDLDNKIKEAYSYIVKQYNHKDNKSKRKEIWLFGFSRGAYIARCVSGMIRCCGILRYDSKYLLDVAYNIYRNRDPNYSPKGYESFNFRKDFSHDLNKTSIKFLGLWDTVGAHGLPEITIENGFEYVKFYDQNVSKIVKNAYQALSIHEDLSAFTPCRIFKLDRREGPTVEETWFPGHHIDVGGGIYAHDKKISDESLLWMIEKIKKTGGLKMDNITIPPTTTSGFIVTSLNVLKHFLPIMSKRIIPLHRDSNGMLTFNLFHNEGDWKYTDLKSSFKLTLYYKTMEDILIQELKSGSASDDNDSKHQENIDEINKYYERRADDEIAKKIYKLFTAINRERISYIKSFSASTISKFDIDVIISKINA